MFGCVWQPIINEDDDERALHCYKAHAKIVRKMGNSTHLNSYPLNIILKLCIRNYAGEITRHANFGFNRCSGGFSPNRRNITILWHFDCPVLALPFFSILRPGRTAGPIFTLYGSNDVFPLNRWSFWELERWVTIFGEEWPLKPPKMSMNRQYQAKTVKYENRNIS